MDYLKRKVNFVEALKGSLVEEALSDAAKAGLAPADAFARTVKRLELWCAQKGYTTVQDVQNLPGNMGQLGFAERGADIYLVVAEINRYYKDKPENEEPVETPAVSRRSRKSPDSKADKK